MKFFIFFSLIFNSMYCASTLGGQLGSDFPYAYKVDYNEVAIFQKNIITTYNIPPSINDLEVDNENCISGPEKGGIYHKGYYYTSCKINLDSNEFVIKICKKQDTNDCTIIESDINECKAFYPGSTIRFFRMSLEEELIGVAWRNENYFCLSYFSGTTIKNKTVASVDAMAKDVDCIYINNHQRTVCAIGKLIDETEYKPYMNIFKGISAASNFKPLNDNCNGHHTRKLRAFPSDSENSNLFYYYYIDTNNDAYIMPTELKTLSEFETGNIFQVSRGCEQIQSSYDIAEDKFVGYNVFICVEYLYKKKIKIQLFKIENNKIEFYNGDMNKPFHVFDKDINSEISMVNFVVLKETLNFGFLTYREDTINNQAHFTIFNQPECYDFPQEGQSNSLKLHETDTFDFTDNMDNDNFEGAKIEIINQSPGIKVTPQDSSYFIEVISEPDKFIYGDITFIFKVKNDNYESKECTATINVIGCNENCFKCDSFDNSFTHQECNECNANEGYYFIENFPVNGYSKNCCKKGANCPDYFYFDDINNIYKRCDDSCLECNGPGNEKCITCYNKNELNKKNYSSEDIDIITKKIKLGVGEYYFEDEHREKCVNTQLTKYYLNETLSSYMPCYNSCGSCSRGGYETSHNCDTCDIGYYKYLDVYSSNCYKKEEKESNLYIDDVLNTDSNIQEKVLLPCSEFCSECEGPDADQCTACTFDSFPECTHGDTFECFKEHQDTHFYFDIDNGCFGECHETCATCDDKRDESSNTNNCLSCDDAPILYNKNCIYECSEIDSTLYNLDDKTCVKECPIYTFPRIIHGKNHCYKCNEDEGERSCIYIGAKELYDNTECIECEEDLNNVFISNDEYNILEDCYDSCKKCKQGGTVEKMNCEECENIDDCLVEGPGNCIPKEDNAQIDFYYRDISADGKCKYYKCYETCKSCDGPGNNLNHNCLTCKDDYQFDPNNPGNCVEICQYYWYTDPQTNLFACTKEEKCPENLPYLVEINNGCVQECSAAFHNDERFFYRYKDTCVIKCPENSIKDNLLYACHSLDQVEDVFTYVSNYISQGTYADNLLVYSKNKYFTLFNTTKEGKQAYQNSAMKVGTSIIDLSNCISTLKQIYSLGENEVLYIGLLDIVRDDTSAPQFEYTILNSYGKKLDINYCINNELTIKKSLNQSSNISLAKNILAEYGYDIIDYNKDNPFFCDICSTFDYDGLDSYDVLLNDRYKYYYKNQDYYFCEDTCDPNLSKISLNESRVECVCKGKGNFTSYKEQSFQKYQKFSQNCKDNYMQYFKCYKKVFNKNLFKNNVGHYFIFFFILFQIGTLLLFYLFSKKPMMSHIHDILIKRAKKGYEKESSEGSNSGSYSGSRSGSRSGSYSSKRSGSRSGSQSVSGSRGGSKSGSKGGSRSGSRSESRSGTGRSGSSGSKSHNFSSGKESNNSKGNPPPKSEKSKYAFVSIDTKDNNNYVKVSQSNNINSNNQVNNEEENNNENTMNNNAPNPIISQKYGKRYISNRNDYVDNSYREDSYNFDIPKGDKSSDDSEEENNQKQNGENGGNNPEGQNGQNNNENGDNNQQKSGKKKGKKNEELPPAAAPAKTDLEKFKDEIKKFRKFSFIELYWFIIRKKHRIISLIVKKDIYDIFSIKFSLLILSYTIDFFITTFFFFEFEIRNIFHKKKHVDPIYVIFMGLVCILISTVLMRIVDYLMEYRMNFKKYEILQKYENDHSNYFNSLNGMIKGFNQKMIIYYTVNFIFSLFIWYMVSAFIGTYYNARYTWGAMLGVNFGLSTLFPFLYYLIAVLLQYKGINKEDYKIYKAGMIMLKI